MPSYNKSYTFKNGLAFVGNWTRAQDECTWCNSSLIKQKKSGTWNFLWSEEPNVEGLF